MFNNQEYTLTANKTEKSGSALLVEFSWKSNSTNSDTITFSDVLETGGITPIPPYLNRKSEISDKKNYQTIYSKHKGSVAAPTSGLHFTQSVFNSLQNKNIETAELTLHIGAGTFRPVTSEKIGGHEMHTEHFFINKQLIKKIIDKYQHIIAVGTTSVRTLESIYWLGVKMLDQNIIANEIKISQWEIYNLPQNIATKKALEVVLNFMIDNNLDILSAATQIIIVPGYKFKIVNGLITNFHMPKSTLLLLVSAFVNNNWEKIYNYALKNKFRF